jgi:hypothetical protein
VAIGALLLCVLAGSPTWGAVLLLARRPATGDPAGLLVLGMGLVGLAGMTLLFHVGQSNLYFLRTALPCLAAGSAWAIVAARDWSRAAVGAAAAAALLGSTAAILLAQGEWFTFASQQPAGSRLLQAAVPYAVLVSLAAALSLAAGVFRRRRSAAPRVPGALVIAALTLAGAGAVQVPAQAVWGVGDWLAGNDGARSRNPGQAIDHDWVRAAEYIREVSDPTDVVLTNVLCAAGSSQSAHCDNRVFWVSAYSERRTLLSGSGYTVSANRVALETGSATPWTLPHWDAARLDRVRSFLREPSPRAAAALADEGVRWVLIVDGHEPTSSSIDRVADVRFTLGEAQVYEMKAAGTSAHTVGVQSRPSSP